MKKKTINIKKILELIYVSISKLAFLIMGMLPVKKDHIIFESFFGKQFSDNPRAIYEYMKKKHPDMNMFWSIDRRYIKDFKDKDLKVLKRLSLRWVYYMARSQYWVVNSRLPSWIPKSNHTIYIQTWHGTPLKKIGVDINDVKIPGTNTKLYKKEFVQESSKWDYLLAPNEYSKIVFKQAFSFEKTIITNGYPRNDILYTNDNAHAINEIKRKLNIPINKKVILYAPTWRDNNSFEVGKYNFDMQLDLEKLKLEYGSSHIILLRMHYLVSQEIDLRAYNEFVYDCSSYSDINELYLVSDVLITDYSSVFFDYANLKRPILFFVYDIEEYRDNLRGFYFDLESKAPGPLVRTTTEIIEEIRNLEKNGYTPTEKMLNFFNEFCYLEDGNASARVVEQFLGGNNK